VTCLSRAEAQRPFHYGDEARAEQKGERAPCPVRRADRLHTTREPASRATRVGVEWSECGLARRCAVVALVVVGVACEQSGGVRLPSDSRTDRGAVAQGDAPPARTGWAINLGGAGADGAAAIAIDPEGNLVVTGDFHGSARFREKTLVATHAGGGGAFVAKLEPASGRMLWATPIEADARFALDIPQSKRHSALNDVAVNRNGEIVIGAHFCGSVTVGGKVLNAGGLVDALVVKLTGGGEVAWARAIGGAGDDLVQAVALDDEGAVVATGMFDGSVDFGGVKRTALGGRDSFVVRYAPDGTLDWVTPLGSGYPDSYPGGRVWEYGFGLALDPSGNAYVAGKFVANAELGPFYLEAEPKFGYATYLAKLDRWGAIVRAEAAPRLGQDVGPRRLAYDPTHGLRLAGMIESKGVNYPLVFAIDPQPDPFVWSPAALSAPWNATGVAMARGTTAIAGVLGSGGGQIGPTAVHSAGGNDVMVARLDAANRILGGDRAGGPGDDGGNGVAIDKQGNLYVVGWFSETATFGDTTLSSAGDYDGFVWKIPAPER
jgi:hypothetical protein